ncbi:MAG TPA: serine/threonine-protein kinase [Kofleriaceae bacterium]|nr:serine/threonine-protein kinase [Kofleriaceae bacterium]
MRAFAPGDVFADRYEILASAGHGGMGHVYRARHITLRKQVALKVLASNPTGDYEIRFAREARALARLDHPNCVRVLDHGQHDATQFLVMEHLEGETLTARIAQGRLPTSNALQIARQLLFALAHAHEHGVIHRDVKPENVMLVKGGTRAILIDFGLASIADEAALTGAGMCLGSPSYLAPERLLGQPHDTRTDLYAVGVILYEMVAGVRPFAGDSPRETMQLAIHRPPRPLRAVRRDIAPALERIISRALAKDPARRFADAEEMLLALADVPSDEDAAARKVQDERDEAAETLMISTLDVKEPGVLSRAWTWVRYGGWRWRHS